MKKFTAIIFDFGGVLSSVDDVSEIGQYLARKYHVSPRVVMQITNRGWKRARINPSYDRIFWRELAHALGISQNILQKEYLLFPRLSLDVVQLVRKLRKRYVVGMLSNQIQTWHLTLMKQWKLQRLFNPIVTSYGEGVAKPDPKIYKRLLRKLKIPADECIYIDDRKNNLPPAKRLGMQTILFKTPRQLKRDLKRLRI